MYRIRLLRLSRYVGMVAMIVCPIAGWNQLFLDASFQLPDDGAKGPSMDVRAADLDQDGDMDIVLANEFKANTILWNDGTGTFVKMTPSQLPQPVHDSEDVAVADFNRDGHVDLIFCSEDDIHHGVTEVHEYYLGDGAGSFEKAPFVFPDSEANAVVTFDVNGDGHPDVVFGNKGFNRIYLNQGDGTFLLETDRLPEINRTTQDLAFADIDGDQDLDLFAANENGNVLYLNSGSGTYADISSTHLPQGINMESRKATFGDVDQDGDPDLFLSNVAFIQGKNIQNRLYLNDGTGHFTDVTSTQLPADTDHTIDAIFEDMDLDGDLDIFLANVFGSRLKVYRNDGMGTFKDETDAILGSSYFMDALGVISADFNGDGLSDLYICDRFMPQNNRKDLLLIRQPLSSIKEDVPQAMDLTVYPNPIRGPFYVQCTSCQPRKAEIQNLQGQVLDSLILDPYEEGIFNGDASHIKLSDGMYLLYFPDLRKKVMVMFRH